MLDYVRKAAKWFNCIPCLTNIKQNGLLKKELSLSTSTTWTIISEKCTECHYHSCYHSCLSALNDKSTFVKKLNDSQAFQEFFVSEAYYQNNSFFGKGDKKSLQTYAWLYTKSEPNVTALPENLSMTWDQIFQSKLVFIRPMWHACKGVPWYSKSVFWWPAGHFFIWVHTYYIHFLVLEEETDYTWFPLYKFDWSERFRLINYKIFE
jgi:hypothetical protein